MTVSNQSNMALHAAVDSAVGTTVSTGFFARVMAALRNLFAPASTERAVVENAGAPIQEIPLIEEESSEGTFVVAPCGYRIRVPRPDGVHASIGEMLSSVREGLNVVPPLPTVVIELLKEIQNAKATATSVAGIAASDPGMAASLIRTVNSAAFGLNRKITSVAEAVNYLGFSTVKSLVLRLQLDQTLGGKSRSNDEVLDLWVHSLAVSYIADCLAKRVKGVDRGFVSTLALLHDIGKLVLHTQFPEQAKNLRELAAAGGSEFSLLEREARVLGVDHAALGAQLASKWGLPGDLVKAIRWHHEPERAFEPSDPIALHQAMRILQVANQLAKYCYVYDDETEVDAIAPEVLQSLGFEGDLPSLLDEEVCAAATRAILFADEGASRPVSRVQRFIRLHQGEAAMAMRKMIEAAPAGKPRIAVDDELAARLFVREAGKNSQLNSPATTAGTKTLISDISRKLPQYSFAADTRIAVAMVSRCLLANLITEKSADRVLVGIGDHDGRGCIAIRSSAMAFAHRFGDGSSSANGARALELELANVINLGWFESISTSSDGETIVITAKAA